MSNTRLLAREGYGSGHALIVEKEKVYIINAII